METFYIFGRQKPVLDIRYGFTIKPSSAETMIYRAHKYLTFIFRSKQCCGCGMFIPDPTFFHPGSRIRIVSIPDSGSASKNLSILTPKKPKKWFLSSRKYDPGCSSRIRGFRIVTFYPSRIQDPGGQKGTGFRIRIRNTGSKQGCGSAFISSRSGSSILG